MMVVIMILMRWLMSHFFPPLRCPDLQPTVSASFGSGGVRGAARLHQRSLLSSSAFLPGKKHFCWGCHSAWKTICMKFRFYFPFWGKTMKRAQRKLWACHHYFSVKWKEVACKWEGASMLSTVVGAALLCTVEAELRSGGRKQANQ